VYISSAGADLWRALGLATAITGCGGTALLDELLASSVRDHDRFDIESRVLAALDAADEILVLLTHTPGLLEGRLLWLALGWAAAKEIPIMGLLDGMTREELIAKSDFPTLIKDSNRFEYHTRQSYLDRLKQEIGSSIIRNSPKTTRSKRKAVPKARGEGEHDVFLCHNSLDKKAVKDIGEKLKAHGLKPWLDEWESDPGSLWQGALEQQIQSIRAVVVFVGKAGIGRWQKLEQAAFLEESVTRECRVIPAILPDCPRTTKLPVLLKTMAWVDFRESEPDPIKQLVRAIIGFKEYRRSGGSA
jgi:hypothetical protein